MGHGLKALALIGLLAVGTAEPAAATMYRFDLDLHWYLTGPLSQASPSCSYACGDAFYVDTGLPQPPQIGWEFEDRGRTIVFMTVDSNGVGTSSTSIGNWSAAGNVFMDFYNAPVLFGPHGIEVSWAGGRLGLCSNGGSSTPHSVARLAAEAGTYHDCNVWGVPERSGAMSGGAWEVVLNGSIRYIPEPGTLMLLSLGLLGLGVTARRRLH